MYRKLCIISCILRFKDERNESIVILYIYIYIYIYYFLIDNFIFNIIFLLNVTIIS